MYKDTSERLEGNDIFEGYAIDLIKEIAEVLSKFIIDLISSFMRKTTSFKILQSI